jgi:hypothetical protein
MEQPFLFDFDVFNEPNASELQQKTSNVMSYVQLLRQISYYNSPVSSFQKQTLHCFVVVNRTYISVLLGLSKFECLINPVFYLKIIIRKCCYILKETNKLQV